MTNEVGYLWSQLRKQGESTGIAN